MELPQRMLYKIPPKNKQSKHLRRERKMNQIKFSHWYQKLEACFGLSAFKEKAELLAVFKTHYNLLHESFKSYDTWIEKDKH